MSTRIGVICEGPIDHILLPVLLSHIATHDASYTWPVEAADVAEPLQIRKRGHGGVLETVRKLVDLLAREPLGYSFVVILLDRRTETVQEEIRKLLAGKEGFVLAIAIEEIEAWWLADRNNTLAWSGFTHESLPEIRYRQQDSSGRLTYAAEKDPEPKRTLNELTEVSAKLESRYGEGNADLAREFAEVHWRPNVKLDEISAQCPHGFGVFRKDASKAFRTACQRQGLLLRARRHPS